MTVAPDEKGINVLQLSRDEAEWNSAVANAIEIEGYSLLGGKENEKTLDLLVGVTFLIKNVTFRMGDVLYPDGPHKGEARDYVSVETMIHPLYAGRFSRKYVVFNDGSTGIYRQIMAALAARGSLDLNESLPDEGEAHGTRYDVSPTLTASTDIERPDHVAYHGLDLLCPEGLRKSVYKVQGQPGDATTWYLA